MCMVKALTHRFVLIGSINKRYFILSLLDSFRRVIIRNNENQQTKQTHNSSDHCPLALHKELEWGGEIIMFLL